jgi:hypothetical protein
MRRGSCEHSALCKSAAQLAKSDQCEVASRQGKTARFSRPTARTSEVPYKPVRSVQKKRKGTSRTPGLSFRSANHNKRDLSANHNLKIPVATANDTLSQPLIIECPKLPDFIAFLTQITT